jgi:NAD-dependent dihydropyrimidine dehydrogenase PreA subunit
MSIDRIDPEICTGCGICVDTCIMDVIRLDKMANKAVIRYVDDCMTCFCCELECPVNAITVSALVKAPLSWG